GPGQGRARRVDAASGDRLQEGARPSVIINRYDQRMFGPGLRKNDLAQVLGEDFGDVIPNNYRLVREAIDRGVPLEEVKKGNNITLALRKAIMQQPEKPASTVGSLTKKLTLSSAR